MRKWTTIAAALLSVGVISTLAIAEDSPKETVQPETAAVSKSKGVIKACVKKRGGAVRIAKRCNKKTERRVTWKKKGTRGVAGTAGVAGAVGPVGATGPAGAAGATGATGASGADGTDGTNGTDGTSTGETFFAQVSGSQTNFGGGGLSCTTAPVGPSITFDAPAGAYIQIMAEAELQRVGGNLAFACLKVDSDAAFQIMAMASLAFEKRFLDKAVAAGTTDKYTIDSYVFPVSAGAHTVSLQYGSDGGQSAFRNRKLWVTMFQPTS